MPKDEFDFDDPMELSGVALFTEEDTTEAMCECFIEEFMRMGHNHKQILALFRNPHYLGTNLVLQKRGEPFIRDQITEIFARWGRTVDSSGSTPHPRSPTISAYRVPGRQATDAREDLAAAEPGPRDTLAPQRGEGRGEGCDQPRCSLAPRALLLLEAKKGGNAPASWPERRTANIELPPRNLRFASRPSFDSSPRPSPRSRRRGSAGWALR